MPKDKKAQDRKDQAALAARRLAEGRKRLEIKPAPLKEHHGVIREVAAGLDNELFDKQEIEMWLIAMGGVEE